MKSKKRRRRINPNTVVLIQQISLGVLLFITIGMIIAGIWYGSRLPALTITTIEASGGETISTEEVTQKAWQQMEGLYFGIVPKIFSYTYPQEAIWAEINTVNRIKDVQVQRVGRKVIQITFDEFQPDALLCQSTDEACLFLDETGYAFGVAPHLTGGSLIRFQLVGGEVQNKTQIFAVSQYETAKELTALLAENGWFINRVDIDAAGDAYLMVVDGGEFKVTLNQSPLETVENVLTILASEDFSHIQPGNFQYIDLRFGNKVFVNELEVVIDSATSTATSSSETIEEI